ncbi:MAG TPA: copper homeostasis protein CutC [Planctomycetota bacterium]|nr:copper homeostasis protein CutC [Planctomycetota bacterium]
MRRTANAEVLVEVAVDSVAGATAAAASGAKRLELCQSLVEGGLTPSVGLCEAVRAAVKIPVFAMVRPRGGDFLYERSELEVMRRDLQHLKAAGVDGIVAGVLLASGELDEARMRELIAVASPLPFTCHRAFDLCADPARAIETLVAVGAARVLTSGQAATAPKGTACIEACVARAGTRLVVMAGGGVRDDNVRALVAATGVREVHLSATMWRRSAMTFQQKDVPMGTKAPEDEYSLRVTDAPMIARVVAAVRAP